MSKIACDIRYQDGHDFQYSNWKYLRIFFQQGKRDGHTLNTGILGENLHEDVIKWKHFSRYKLFVREPTGHRWFPRTKASDAEIWCFLLAVSRQTVEQTIQTPVIKDAITLIMTSL